jgi:hypothetical protein
MATSFAGAVRQHKSLRGRFVIGLKIHPAFLHILERTYLSRAKEIKSSGVVLTGD